MGMIKGRVIRFALWCLVAAVPAGAAAATITQSSSPNLAIPDGDPSGVVDEITVSSLETQTYDVNLTLTLSGSGFGAYNGDLYAYLTHGSEISILLNRPGRRADNLLGYSDSGFSSVVFDDSAANGDIHVYRLVATGSHEIPLGIEPSPLTGVWAPDGRNVDPAGVLDTTPQLAPLGVFGGTDPNGEWTLFVADLSAGGTAVLESWTLEIVPVPEPSTVVLVGVGLLTFVMVRRRARVGGTRR